ncbi:hypothetical protein HY224_00380 [Candidatus Uhrbacteria bacterium]|nr:hypothetical protein [Candidatus Uhrbacteria bacterium]
MPEMESLRKNKSFDFNRLKMELETINVHLGDLSIELTDYHRKEVLKNSVKLRQAEERLEAVMDEFLEIAEDYMRNDLDDYDPGEAFNLESENPDRLKKFKSSLKGTAEQERMIFSLYKNIVLLERKLMDHTIWI